MSLHHLLGFELNFPLCSRLVTWTHANSIPLGPEPFKLTLGIHCHRHRGERSDRSATNIRARHQQPICLVFLVLTRYMGVAAKLDICGRPVTSFSALQVATYAQGQLAGLGSGWDQFPKREHGNTRVVKEQQRVAGGKHE